MVADERVSAARAGAGRHDRVHLSGEHRVHVGPDRVRYRARDRRPYSAEAVTDVVQTLADGNRIVRQNKAQISRDSQGRTRREEGFAMFGPLVNGPTRERTAQRADFRSDDRHAWSCSTCRAGPRTGCRRRRDLMLRNKIAGVNGSAGVNVDELNVEKFRDGSASHRRARAGAAAVSCSIASRRSSAMRSEKPVVESLGTQFMEGVAVEGTRTTMTIPAGQIGNEQPINIVSERWFSPDLKVLVMSRQSDPRFGETTYRLTNLTRAEPSPQLFEIPADFTIVDPGGTATW